MEDLLMQNNEETNVPDWGLEEWEKAITIKVGSSFVCRNCGNIVMVTKGGVGVLDLKCCGKQMEPVPSRGDKQ